MITPTEQQSKLLWAASEPMQSKSSGKRRHVEESSPEEPEEDNLSEDDEGDASPEEQGENDLSEDDEASAASEEFTSGFFSRSKGVDTARLNAKRHHNSRESEDKESDSESVKSHGKRRKEYVSSPNESGTNDAKPEILSKERPQGPSVKCVWCWRQDKFCDQVKPKCSTCVKFRVACIPQGQISKDAKCETCFKNGRVCDEGRPQCGNCQERALDCKYLDPPNTSRREPGRG